MLLGAFFGAFCDIGYCLCCNWFEDLRPDNSTWWWWQVLCDPCGLGPFYLFIFCISCCVSVQIKALDTGHRQHRNHSMTPCGVVHSFSSWRGLRKICSITLKEESHKSNSAVTATQQLCVWVAVSALHLFCFVSPLLALFIQSGGDNR